MELSSSFEVENERLPAIDCEARALSLRKEPLFEAMTRNGYFFEESVISSKNLNLRRKAKSGFDIPFWSSWSHMIAQWSFWGSTSVGELGNLMSVQRTSDCPIEQPL